MDRREQYQMKLAGMSYTQLDRLQRQTTNDLVLSLIAQELQSRREAYTGLKGL